jgi:GDP/UDP-N,N'-diacetylbacillosamine 2-epimerase (hydrolysing)
MSHLHFVATDEYRRRVIQLGENPGFVYRVGGLGVDAIAKMKLLDRASIETALDFRLGEKNLLITFHPATLEFDTAAGQLAELLAALDTLKGTNFIFTMPNADAEGRELIKMVDEFVSTRPNAKAFTSLGQLRYLSCIAHVDGVVGNSSSGLAEVPSFKKGTINIGDRQRGRLKASSVIDCQPTRRSISEALHKLYSANFQATLDDARNPYGEGGASERIISILKGLDIDQVLKKKFHDLPIGEVGGAIRENG